MLPTILFSSIATQVNANFMKIQKSQRNEGKFNQLKFMNISIVQSFQFSHFNTFPRGGCHACRRLGTRGVHYVAPHF